jgi:diguanylate cyclase
VSDSLEWKQKYRDSLVEMEGEEKQWRAVEQVLRRLIGRLCAAGMGVDPQLDSELSALAAANRRNADAAELEQLAQSLTTAVVAVDATVPVLQLAVPLPSAKPGRWNTTCAAVAALLEQLQATSSDLATLQHLGVDLKLAGSDAALASVVGRTANLIRAHSDSVARERLQAAALLAEVTKRLEEMASYLTESSDVNRSLFDDTRSLNETVLSQVLELSDEVSAASGLGTLQSVVRARLETVAAQVRAFRDRETNRQREFNGRQEHMRARIKHLERESRELKTSLDMEKHGARLDPLTGVANRKSFDERFALEIARRTQGGGLSVIQIWDVDNFKHINDSYGHRAGDRVLQSVASCFDAALRTSDMVARIGGEEFGLLLGGIDIPEAMKFANQLRTKVEGLRFHFRGAPVRITASCGMTDLQVADTAGSAFDRADAALYKAKEGGRNLCVAA